MCQENKGEYEKNKADGLHPFQAAFDFLARNGLYNEIGCAMHEDMKLRTC